VTLEEEKKQLQEKEEQKHHGEEEGEPDIEGGEDKHAQNQEAQPTVSSSVGSGFFDDFVNSNQEEENDRGRGER
jgi:hypothetical protein